MKRLFAFLAGLALGVLLSGEAVAQSALAAKEHVIIQVSTP